MEKKYFGRFKKPLTTLPNLVEPQVLSYKWMVEEGLKEIFKEFSPIKDYSDKKFMLEFVSFELGTPKYDEHYAKANKLSYEAPLRTIVRLTNKSINSKKEQEIFMVDFPLMTDHGTFVINGVERVIVPQLARSFGVLFTLEEVKGRGYFGARVIPSRGAWIEFESDPDGAMYVRIDRKRKFPVTSLLRVMGAETDSDILALAQGDEHFKKVLELTLAKDTAKTKSDSYIEIYKRMRDGDLATADNARDFVNSIFETERYDISPVGRFRFNKRFNLGLDEKTLAIRTLNLTDISLITKHVVELNNTPGARINISW
jgi:DNA-directed RNA polymerase subunit beta